MANQSLEPVRIGNLGRVITGKTPPTIRPELFGDEYPFITPTDIQEDSRIVETARFLSEDGRAFQKNILLPTGTVCYTCIGATIGKICITTKPSFTNQQINSIIVDETQYDNRFVYYLLKQETPRIKVNAGGAATPIINKSVFSDIEVNAPSLPVQRRIADILSAYDDLIENNTRRIRILEQMAQAIYQEWFGKVDRESLPKGWELKPLGEIIDFKNGKAITAENEGDFPIYGSNGIIGKTNESRYKNAIIIGRVGAYCGSINYCSTQFSASDNTIIASPLPNSGFAENFAYRLLMNMNLRRYAGGAAQPLLTQSVLTKLETLVPPSSLCLEYEKIATNLFDLQTMLENKNANLRETRDLLLPRLISGEMEV